MDKVSENSPTRQLLSKEPKYVLPFVWSLHFLTCTRSEANFKRHPDSVSASSKVKLVRYQVNPTANWGPGTKAGGKRKRGKDDEGEQ